MYDVTVGHSAGSMQLYVVYIQQPKKKGKDAGFSPTFAALFLPESLLFEDISHSVELTGSDTETSVT